MSEESVMDFRLSDEQEQLALSARRLIRGAVDPARLREIEASDSGYDTALWRQFVEQGWCAIPFHDDPARLSYLAVVAQEMGRAALPSPFGASVAAGYVVSELGTGSTSEALAERISDGHPVSLVSALDGAIRLERHGGGATLSTTRELLVDWLPTAEELVLVVPDGDDVGIVLIPAEAPGVRALPRRSFDAERVGALVLESVAVPADRFLSRSPISRERAEEALLAVGLLRAADAVGGAEHVVELTVGHVSTREQFGHPLGVLQAVQHKAADMAMWRDGASLAVGEALGLVARGENVAAASAMAAYVALRNYERIVTEGIQLHGGLGFTQEYQLQFYFRRAKAQQLRAGARREQLGAIARLVVRPEYRFGVIPGVPIAEEGSA
jgi:alkylation response protein AidB-like acyl-CoA dehydrogenase